MAVTQYTHSLATDFGGSFNADKWTAEIHAQGSGISIQVDSVTVSGDDVDTYMKDALPGGKADLDALTSSHDGTPNSSPQEVQVTAKIGGRATMTDGLSLSCAESAQAHADYTVPEEFHVQGVAMIRDGFHVPDYGLLRVIHPLSIAAAPQAHAEAATDITVDNTTLAELGGQARSILYDPANGAQHLEAWSADGTTLLEVRKIASVNTSTGVVTLASGVAYTGGWPNAAILKVRYKSFVPVRGDLGFDGGFRLVGGGQVLVENVVEITEPLTAGLFISASIITGSQTGTRQLAVNFVFRQPSAA